MATLRKRHTGPTALTTCTASIGTALTSVRCSAKRVRKGLCAIHLEAAKAAAAARRKTQATNPHRQATKNLGHKQKGSVRVAAQRLAKA